ncbi:MAG: hypothetical protein ACKOC6_10670 [bacterium]
MSRALLSLLRPSSPPRLVPHAASPVLVALVLAAVVLVPLAPVAALVAPAHANLPTRPVDHPGDPLGDPPLEVGDPDNGQDLLTEYAVVLVAGQPFVFRVPLALAHALRRFHTPVSSVHDRSANRR